MSARPETILALDAAGQACAVAVWRGGDVLAQTVEPMRRGQAERLVPLIEATLSASGLAGCDLDAVAVTTGPGGFTGVRIGLAAARGYGLGLGVPVFGVSRFAVTAAMVRRDRLCDGPFVVAIDARRTEVCAQAFDACGNPLAPAHEIHPDVLAQEWLADAVAIAGDAAERVADSSMFPESRVAVLSGTAMTDPAAVARAALHDVEAGRRAAPRPLYLRDPDVTLPPSSQAASGRVQKGGNS